MCHSGSPKTAESHKWAAGKADEAWRALNARQRMYLSAIYDADQAAERDIRTRSARWEKTLPADEWRMLLYDLKLPKDILGYSTIQEDLRREGKHDTGAGSTLAVLERRGLVLVVHDKVFVPLVGMHPGAADHGGPGRGEGRPGGYGTGAAAARTDDRVAMGDAGPAVPGG